MGRMWLLCSRPPLLVATCLPCTFAGIFWVLSDPGNVGWSVTACVCFHVIFCQASSYLNKLPAKFNADDLILITDPMLATGGTMMQV